MFSLLPECVSLESLSSDVIRLSALAFIIALFLYGIPGICIKSHETSVNEVAMKSAMNFQSLADEIT